MNLPQVFRRYIAPPALLAGQVEFGTDTALTSTSAPITGDYVGQFSAQDQAGSPITSIVIAYNGPNATVGAKLWIWEGSTQSWIQVGGTLSLAKGAFTKVAVPAVYGDIKQPAGGIMAALIVDATVPGVAGTHVFAFGPSAS